MSVQIQKITHFAWDSTPHIIHRTEIVDLPIYIEDLDEDALDRECVPFEEVEEEIAHRLWYEDRIGAGEFDPQVGAVTDCVSIGFKPRHDTLELAREGSLAGPYLTDRLE